MNEFSEYKKDHLDSAYIGVWSYLQSLKDTKKIIIELYDKSIESYELKIKTLEEEINNRKIK